jgi:hypothetical protein
MLLRAFMQYLVSSHVATPYACLVGGAGIRIIPLANSGKALVTLPKCAMKWQGQNGILAGSLATLEARSVLTCFYGK